MTDRSDFERRFEARLQAHADRAAQRPFDAAADARGALAGDMRRSLRWRGWPSAPTPQRRTPRRDHRLDLLVGLAAGIVCVGAACRTGSHAPRSARRGRCADSGRDAGSDADPSISATGRARPGLADGDIYLEDPDGADPVKIADGDPYVDLAGNLGRWVGRTGRRPGISRPTWRDRHPRPDADRGEPDVARQRDLVARRRPIPLSSTTTRSKPTRSARTSRGRHR